MYWFNSKPCQLIMRPPLLSIGKKKNEQSLTTSNVLTPYSHRSTCRLHSSVACFLVYFVLYKKCELFQKVNYILALLASRNLIPFIRVIMKMSVSACKFFKNVLTFPYSFLIYQNALILQCANAMSQTVPWHFVASRNDFSPGNCPQIGWLQCINMRVRL